jgi:hypothetical protein
MSTQEGLTFDGEPVASGDGPDPNTQAGFDAMLASKVDRAEGTTEGTTEEPAEQPSDPSKDSAEDIRAQLVQKDPNSTNISDGLTITPSIRKPSETPNLKAHVAEGQKMLDAEAAQTQAMKDELALRRYTEVLEHPDLTDEIEAVAAYHLAQEAPAVFAGLVNKLDDDAVDEQIEFGVEDDEFLDDRDLPGYQLNQRVEFVRAALKEQQTREQIQKLEAHREQEQMKALHEVYTAQGIHPSDFEAQAMLDFRTLREFGIDPRQASPEEFRANLEQLQASREALDEAERVAAFKQSLFDTPTGNVAEGLEYVGPDGQLRPAQPRPDFTPSNEKLLEQIEAKMAQKTTRRPMTKAEFKAAMTAPEPTDWRNGLTTDDGTPTSVDEITGAKRRREQREREERARMLQFLPGKRS